MALFGCLVIQSLLFDILTPNFIVVIVLVLLILILLVFLLIFVEEVLNPLEVVLLLGQVLAEFLCVQFNRLGRLVLDLLGDAA